MLPALPEEVPLRPHVNVGKQRLIAEYVSNSDFDFNSVSSLLMNGPPYSIVRDVVAGQQMAFNYTLAEVDGDCFIKCSCLRAEPPERLDELTAKM